MTPLTKEDTEHLRLFREAARQVRDASVIAEGRTVHMRGRRTGSGDMEVSHELLHPEAFRSLAVSVRLVYQSGEPAHFGHICNILVRHDPGCIRPAVADLRARYNKTLNDHDPLVAALALGDKTSYTPRDLLETWLYFGVFHQNQSLRADYEALSRLGDNFGFAVQSIVLKLAGRIMDLDDVVADVLSEPRIPRIAPTT